MILPILNYPDKRLRTKAKHVNVIDETIQTLIKDMFETIYAKDGIGLAATQVDQHLQVVVIDLEPNSQDDYQLFLKNFQRSSHKQSQKHHPLCFINPRIKEKDGQEKHIEGCLSVPDFQAEVQRANHIKVEALNEKGEVFTLQATGLLAICIQHELDHLKGVLFVDYLSKLKQKRLLKKTKKMTKN
ncbi:peptide deformylase [Candidatus Ruthia magnifica str. Cm (Calyptogena magnifica)]|uniref:Peptide deformylase n=2 Tax=Candidatus Ruthturnera TaxID=1541743 RepID=A1AXL8_RUTMC|nr:peptide deformylase [Candidatus Ruthia magnifica str. Cm (Calyptogena magnifica)]